MTRLMPLAMSHECFKFVTGKDSTIIRANNIWDTMNVEHFSMVMEDVVEVTTATLSHLE